LCRFPHVRIDELDYELPEELIASEPTAERDASRLLVVGKDGGLSNATFRDLLRLVPPSLFVMNDTRVFPARLLGRKASGGRFEFLLLERLEGAGSEETWLAFGKSSKGFREGDRFEIAEGFELTVAGRGEDGTFVVKLSASGAVADAIESAGAVPLPPYMKREARPFDDERYQTVYAKHSGSVAAPTAGLHFTPELMTAMREAGHRFAFVTLHVGAGTFKPVKADNLDDHVMHHERFEVSEETASAIGDARAEGRLVVGVGTTVVRTVEAVAQQHGSVIATAGSTDLFVKPGFEFRVLDALITNFHLPRSTLLSLVMAFAGKNHIRTAYEHAVRERYRFFSYGDAMLLFRSSP
jgi:S-adenosylmethionine:tRNA ribosyltransferase-isomerase